LVENQRILISPHLSHYSRNLRNQTGKYFLSTAWLAPAYPQKRPEGLEKISLPSRVPVYSETDI